MKCAFACLVFCAVVWASPAARGADMPFCEPWRAAYAGNDATGAHVLGLWTFDDDKLADASGHSRPGQLRGATFNAAGRFGACLKSARGVPVEDKPHGVWIKHQPSLSPKDAFTIEMWINPKPEFTADYPQAFLLDKKYVSHADYQMFFAPADRNGNRALHVSLGFGNDSASWRSDPLTLAPGTWRHVAFTYDGQGLGCFYVDGELCGSQQYPDRKAVAAGTRDLVLGDRSGSCYHGFPGLIDEVRLSSGAREFRRLRFQQVSDRACFVRMEPAATLQYTVTNLQHEAASGVEVALSLGGVAQKTVKLETLAPGKSAALDLPLDTTLRPDVYRVVCEVRTTGTDAFTSREESVVRIVPRQPPQFPVLMWGVYSPANVLTEMTRLKQIGFNHVLGLGCDAQKIWDAGRPVAPDPEKAAATKRMLDEALANQMTIVASLSPARLPCGMPEFQRVDRQGKHPPKRPGVCGLFPQISPFCYNVGAAVAEAYGKFPAFGAALLHTEVRDHATPCFHPHDLEAFRKATGIDVPAEVASRGGVSYKKLADFPADHVIPDNHPLYVYYRWYWKTGDAWNSLNTALDRGLKTMGRPDFWTFHDPAARVASVYGSGGSADVLSQWTYTYPNPLRIGLATDELLAMADGAAAAQNVMKMTQIIWYRNQTAPIPQTPADALPYRARWEKEQPDAPFITIAPMHLREAFWTKIARPIKGIMYHGWQSLVPTDARGGYRYTNPNTKDELAHLIHDVLQPLGPTLLKTPGVKSDVAILESFASEMFAQRGTYGWGRGTTADAYHALLYAHLQPEIIFDETVMQRGLDGYRVLVMADCDVITKTMAERIKAFQAKGGIVVGDDHVAPAIKPDIRLAAYQATGHNQEDKAALQNIAAALRKQIDARYARYVDSTNPDVIPYLRRYQQTDYVFLVNDCREYGQYVGQHKIVMENGLPAQAAVSVRRPRGYVYDLVHSQPVAARQKDGCLMIDADLDPCDGGLYMVSSQAIDRVKLQMPATLARGDRATCRIEVVDANGKPIAAIVPVQVTIRDGADRLGEFSGYHAAVDGKLEIPLDIAGNDPMGYWQVEVRELASGRTAKQGFHVPAPDLWPQSSKPVTKEQADPVQPKG